MKIKSEKRFFGGLNSDDNPANLPEGDYVGALNIRTGGSSEQHGEGILETLQGEIGILISPDSTITYYGTSIGGQFVYSGYDEIVIGTQTWMKKNYDVNYPGSKVYDDDEDNAPIYGRLYTHDQIMSSTFCPAGWRVPTEADIDTLLTYLGGVMIAGGKMKNVGTELWTTPNTGADDLSAFTAVPGGKFDLLFELLGNNCLLWLQDDGVPEAPVALNGSEITVTTFVTNWSVAGGATGYYLDVATDALFTSLVAGYNNLDVGNVLTYSIIGLSPFTNYYYRVRGYNEVGTGDNSNIQTIKTLDRVVDADGNAYTYVTIGTQQWLVENLKTSKYADGTPIPNLTLNADWIAEDGTAGHDGAYCWYDNDIANKTPYGALYNWYAVNNAHGLAPTGWRIPSNADFATLVTFAGGSISTGGKLKESGTSHWNTPNTGATNEYGFKALPSGERSGNSGAFSFLGIANYLWKSTEFNTTEAYVTYMLNTSGALIGTTAHDIKKKGNTIRCMRDIP
jgi:uncharacterized protein (TIGR02145 family)